MRHLAILLILPAFLLAGEATAPKDPTAEEVMFLDLLNQHREDPAHNEERITTAIRSKQVSANLGAWTRFALTSGKKPTLAFSPQLTEAARSLLKSGAKPADKTRFDAGPAVQAAGYKGDKDCLAMFAMSSPSLGIAYAAALLNAIGETEINKQPFPDYAGIKAVKGDWREAGVAVASANGKYTVVIILGKGSAKRHLGGIVFADANRNGRCELGEGKAGVKVACGAATMTTSAGGAWWLALDSLDQAEVTFSVDAFTAVRPVAKDATTATVDWRVPNPADLKTADRLIADAEKDSKNPDTDKRKGPLSALLVGTRLAALDDARQKKVNTLVEPIREDFESTLKRVLAALGEEPADFKKRLTDIQRPWKGAMSGWFKEADALSRMRQLVNAALAGTAEQQAKQAPPLIKLLAKSMAETCDPAFLEQYRIWESSLEAVVPAESAPVKKK